MGINHVVICQCYNFFMKGVCYRCSPLGLHLIHPGLHALKHKFCVTIMPLPITALHTPRLQSHNSSEAHRQGKLSKPVLTLPQNKETTHCKVILTYSTVALRFYFFSIFCNRHFHFFLLVVTGTIFFIYNVLEFEDPNAFHFHIIWYYHFAHSSCPTPLDPVPATLTTLQPLLGSGQGGRAESREGGGVICRGREGRWSRGTQRVI